MKGTNTFPSELQKLQFGIRTQLKQSREKQQCTGSRWLSRGRRPFSRKLRPPHQYGPINPKRKRNWREWVEGCGRGDGRLRETRLSALNNRAPPAAREASPPPPPTTKLYNPGNLMDKKGERLRERHKKSHIHPWNWPPPPPPTPPAFFSVQLLHSLIYVML